MSKNTYEMIREGLEQATKVIQLRELTLTESIVVETEHGDCVYIPAGTVLKVSEPVR